ncbi:deoxyguanosinetriphosphate triphosphohydrolase [Pedobacter rhodius]|uniref:Deoxyguanosinetriphosphate triphosphohydrolase n=1 Tax=Pedobacter rhodius TaxID=3004098 RepID=A0ABT4L2V8_9SPHI|nr:deoxyguanosinetriphosphate triphosphohydrolase [Pedobacter sp. SJ11]MCZ4225517.1 deoxyguanosinetriphosphate triphosphohydrolase [Pedobacter sp. SJ11]
MDWKKLISNKRFGQEQYGANSDKARSDFQRDYDRLIFSSPFRRLQNKTQVFPLPGSIFVHNRLTHSLEVASVARSMANIFLNTIEEKNPQLIKEVPLISEVGNIVAAAALAHDLGNPAFGHSGEAAISRYFTDGDGKVYKKDMNDAQWHDLINFEGNANAIRILTHPLKGKGNDAYALTYSTLASIAKYPCASIAGKQKGILHRKKYGFFQSEEESFKRIASELGLEKEDNEYLIYKRHPLVYLVEAADDICYSIIDLEDAHRLKILSYEEVKGYLLPFANSKTIEDRLKNDYEDDDAKIGLLRAKAINTLTVVCAGIFYNTQEALLKGELNKSLTELIPEPYFSAWKAVERVSVERIYNFSSVIQKEVAGYKIMAGLLEEFVPALIHNNTHYYKKLVKLIPKQYHTDLTDIYSRTQSVLDFVSGMTDLYAVDLYRNIKGISFPSET